MIAPPAPAPGSRALMRRAIRLSPASRTAVALYQHPLPYAQKAKIALREKGLTFDVETPQGLGSG